MNFERFEFKELEVDHSQIKGVLQCLLHSILFNRALGSFQPKDAECEEVENTPYAKLDDSNVDTCVDTFIERFTSGLKKSGSNKGNVCLGFHEKSVKKNFFGFGAKEEKVYWERWIIPITATNDKEKQTSQAERDAVIASRQSRLVECLMFLVSSINEKRDHIPPLKSNSPAALAFSFELSFTFGDKADESWGLNTIKRMLKQGPPMLLS